MKLEKKAREYRALGAVCSAIKDFPAGDIKCSESPDFLIEGPSYITGIEVTEIYRDDRIGRFSRRQREGLIKKVVNKARSMAVGSKVPPADVSVYFANPLQLTSLSAEKLAERLAQVVRTNLPEVGETRNVRNTYEDLEAFPWQINKVIVNRRPDEASHFWRTPIGGFVDSEFSAKLQSAISKKTPKLDRYLAKCDKCWLIVAPPGDGASSLFEGSEKTFSTKYESNFNRIFFVDPFNQKVSELQLEASPRRRPTNA